MQFFGVFLHRFPEGRRLLLAQAVALGGVELADSIFQAIESADLADGPKRFADRFLQRLVEAPASVRRLVRDGVDSPLANLFVQVAATPPPNAEGANRARSATEAFLYRRLETLTETAGKFHLNVELPIAFDGWGRMEVDLLCERPRLAIELDGSQHLGDPDAYRRDRRKDALLQENGYRVLRFLAEDVGMYFDQVLDGILRALSPQGARI